MTNNSVELEIMVMSGEETSWLSKSNVTDGVVEQRFCAIVVIFGSLF
ncbi:hypothetical protein [uncultured Sphaerochaeta sp.]|nr:hypothetical protein [uncultured Sphaerochaeta sp.]